MSNAFFQTLESRTMLSAAPVNPKLIADQQQLAVDVAHLNSDRKLRDTTLAADRKAIEADKKAVDAAKKLAKLKLEADSNRMTAELAIDSKASKTVRDRWTPILASDLAKIKADGDHGEHLAEHQAKYEADMKSFRDAMAPCEAETKADIAKWTLVLNTDKAMLEDAGSESVAKLNADTLKLKLDDQHFKELIAGDEAKVKADVELIKKDSASPMKK